MERPAARSVGRRDRLERQPKCSNNIRNLQLFRNLSGGLRRDRIVSPGNSPNCGPAERPLGGPFSHGSALRRSHRIFYSPDELGRGGSSKKTSQVKPQIFVSASLQASGGSWALRQVSARNCSALKWCSTATCGSSSPRWRPLEISRP